MYLLMKHKHLGERAGYKCIRESIEPFYKVESHHGVFKVKWVKLYVPMDMCVIWLFAPHFLELSEV